MDSNHLYILYYYQYAQKKNSENSASSVNHLRPSPDFAYSILKIHGNSCLIDKNEQIQLFEKMFSRKVGSELIGPFHDLKELNQFSVELLKKNEIQEASLLSVHDFNMGIQSMNRIGDFVTIFQEYGRKIRAEKARKAKTSWFRID